jgi:DHA2 family methylenomycin A resistance protein-like MFS transporter
MNSSARHTGLVLAALASGFVMASVDATVVNVAAVSIRASFGSTLTGLTWVVDVYVLTFASLLLLAGGLASAFGSRRLYLAGMVVFLVASIGCAIAPSEAMLIAARAVEGIGAALFMPSSLALLVGTFTESGQRAKMLGLWSAMVATAAAIGPSVGGVLVSAFGWRSIFLINVPVVVAGLLLTVRIIPSRPGTGQRVSPVANLLFFVVIASGAYVLIQGRSSGFGARPVMAAAAALVIGSLILVVQQRRAATPIMPWHLFARPSFAIPNIVGFLYSAALYGNLYLLGLFLQNARHVSAFEAGLQLLPMTVCFPLGNIVYTRIHHRASNPAIMTTCLLIAGIATLLLVPAAPSTPYWYIAVTLGAANSGAGLVTASMTAATVQAAGDEHANYAGAVLNTNRQLGVLVGVATIGLILASTNNWYHGLHIAFCVVGGAYLLATIAAFALARGTNAIPQHEVGSCSVPSSLQCYRA